MTKQFSKTLVLYLVGTVFCSSEGFAGNLEVHVPGLSINGFSEAAPMTESLGEIPLNDLETQATFDIITLEPLIETPAENRADPIAEAAPTTESLGEIPSNDLEMQAAVETSAGAPSTDALIENIAAPLAEVTSTTESPSEAVDSPSQDMAAPQDKNGGENGDVYGGSQMDQETQDARYSHENPAALSSPTTTTMECVSPYRNMWAAVRHSEAHGVGYKKGYTTLEAFFLSDYFGNRFLPFVDLRGHVFNNGKFAGNAGIGVRSLISPIEHYFGAYVYYDARNSRRLTLNQIGPGVELLGRRMEYRINAYFQVGKKKSHDYGIEFDEFKGQNLIIKSKRKFGLSGVDGEVGAHFVQNTTKYDLFGGIGPYYLWGTGTSGWGGKARLTGRYKQYVSLEVAGTYDRLFKGTLQGSIAFSIPLGPKLKRTAESCSPAQNDDLLLTRAVQAPYRFEIPIIKTHTKKEVAIDPNTGKPYTFWFVDNTSSSLGTFESPFPTLVQAQKASAPNDIIYVFQGDGTSKGMNAGINLQNNQKLFGSGIEQSLLTTRGTIIMPALTSGNPVITNTTADYVMLLANGNEVSGLNLALISTSFYGIVGNTGTSGASIHDNIFTGAVGAAMIGIVGNGSFLITNNQFSTIQSSIPGGYQAIRITTDPGTFISGAISGNTINSGFVFGIGVNADGGGSRVNYTITGNSISNTIGVGNAIFLGSGDGSISGPITASITNNSINNMDYLGIQIAASGQAQCVTIQGNQINNTVQPGIDIVSATGTLSAFVINNTVTNVGAGQSGISISARGSSTMCLGLTGNTSTSTAAGTFGYAIAPTGSTGTIDLEPLVGNVGSFAQAVGPVTSVPAGACPCNQSQ